MKWRSIHNYGDGIYIEIEGQGPVRPITTEAASIVIEQLTKIVEAAKMNASDECWRCSHLRGAHGWDSPGDGDGGPCQEYCESGDGGGAFCGCRRFVALDDVSAQQVINAAGRVEVPPFAEDPDVDVKVFADRTHDVMAAFIQAGGTTRLRCMICGLIGMRLYQDAEVACAYAKRLSGPNGNVRPRCQRAISTT